MANICSKHLGYKVANCKPCNTTIEQALPQMSDAVAAGKHFCEHCGFAFYKTIDCCPYCDKVGASQIFRNPTYVRQRALADSGDE